MQQAIADGGLAISLVPEADIRAAMKELFEAHAVVVEPSSAITPALVKARGGELEEPICVIFTGENIAREDLRRLISAEQDASNASLCCAGRNSFGCNPFDCALEIHAATGSCVGTLLRI